MKVGPQIMVLPGGGHIQDVKMATGKHRRPTMLLQMTALHMQRKQWQEAFKCKKENKDPKNIYIHI